MVFLRPEVFAGDQTTSTEIKHIIVVYWEQSSMIHNTMSDTAIKALDRIMCVTINEMVTDVISVWRQQQGIKARNIW